MKDLFYFLLVLRDMEMRYVGDILRVLYSWEVKIVCLESFFMLYLIGRDV